MPVRFCKYGALLSLLVLGATTGCERARDTATGPSSVSSGSALGSSVSFEPAMLRPEPLPDSACTAQPAFATRIVIIVNGDGVIVRGLRFSFTDRFAVTALPRVIPIPGPSPLSVPASAIPPLSPIPPPGVAVPLPGAPLDRGTMDPTGSSRRLAFLLRFDCGVAPAGTLFVATEVAEPGGTFRTPEFRVAVGS